jgi:hypothetical protein
VVSQRHQHRFEQADLGLARAALGHQPQRQLTEPDLAHQVRGQILPEQRDRIAV